MRRKGSETRERFETRRRTPELVRPGRTAKPDLVRWFAWKNQSDYECPPHGLIHPTGSEPGTELVLLGERPSAAFSRIYAVNSATATPAGSAGLCTFDSPIVVLTEDEDHPLGTGWSPWRDSWMAKRARAGACLTALANVEGEGDQMWSLNHPIDTLIGVTTAPLGLGNSCEIELWEASANVESASTIVLSAFDWLLKFGATPIGANKKVLLQWINGFWYVSEAECP